MNTDLWIFSQLLFVFMNSEGRFKFNSQYDVEIRGGCHRRCSIDPGDSQLESPFGDISCKKMAHRMETALVYEGSQPLMETVFWKRSI